jgi:SAM-dependent methyltransferase
MSAPNDNAAKPNDQLFDEYADKYEATLRASLSPTGETKDYYAQGRVDFLRDMLARFGVAKPNAVVDFGCGTGSATPFLREAFAPQRIFGVDVSPKSIETARHDYGAADATFELLEQANPSEEFDLAYVNGVFHHIPLDERDGAASWVFRALKPGGYFAWWENNPWNPGTRWLMHRCPFDDDAIPISAPSARRLLRRAGFEIVRTDFLFIFPRSLRWMRWTERPLSRLPLGGQYQVLCRKPAARAAAAAR